MCFVLFPTDDYNLWYGPFYITTLHIKFDSWVDLGLQRRAASRLLILQQVTKKRD